MTENRTVRLVSVNEEALAELSDLIGALGSLRPSRSVVEDEPGLVFMPQGRCDWLLMTTEELSEENGKLTVSTSLGNTFTFRVLN